MDEKKTAERLRQSMLPPGSGASLCATRHAGLVSIEPLTASAEAWLNAYAGDEASWMGPCLMVEMRYWRDLADAAIEAGLTFERDAMLN